MEGIFDTLKSMALVQTGAAPALRLTGCGRAATAHYQRVASGPVSLKIFDAATEAVKQGAPAGARTWFADYNHPDIMEFICCKERETD